VKRALCILVAAPLLVTATTGHAAPEGKPRKAVVAGPADDPLVSRVQKELTALGFETVRIGPADGCTFQALAPRVESAGAVAAACSDGEQVGVWALERPGLRLREVVLGGSDDHARDVAAVRAAEIMRAAVELKEQEDNEAAVRGELAPRPPPTWKSERDREVAANDRPVTPTPPADGQDSSLVERKAPIVAAGVGMGALLGADASTGTFNAHAEVGILRWLAIAGRLDYPLETQELSRGGQQFEVAPGFAGGGASLPLMSSSSFVIPRLGAGFGVSWINARAPDRRSFVSNSDGSITEFVAQRGGSDMTASPVAYLSAAVSMRIYGPMRLTADGMLGSSVSRMVVRSSNTHIAYWGQPLGALSLRLEVLIR